MGGCIQKNIFILFSFHNHFNLIASHANSHTNTSIGLIANNNNNNAIRGLMNNIIINNNNNNNIIICFSLILQSSRESNPTPRYSNSCLVQLCQAQHFIYGLYTTNTTKGVAPSSSLCRAAILLYYDVLLYASYVKGSLTYNKIKENTNSRNRTHVYRFGICSITTILCSQLQRAVSYLHPLLGC